MSDVATKEYVDQIMATVPLSGTVVAGTSLVGANITKDALREVDEYRRAIVNLESKIQQLEAWKESALAVEREWNPNALATMLGGKLGESHRKVIQREVPKLLARIKRLEEAGDRMKTWLRGDARNGSKELSALRQWRKAKEAKP